MLHGFKLVTRIDVAVKTSRKVELYPHRKRKVSVLSQSEIGRKDFVLPSVRELLIHKEKSVGLPPLNV